ncbi:hypothetical protein [Curtobacterium pusillum]|uniref:hypothetical protein n=1 Tax=Curtobacterium pusillum TaxID=69373 RepID=UPI0011A3DBBB|nr:hypothetical protein [Curtobacterium pusillum]
MAVEDPVKALIERRREEWRQEVRQRYRFRPWKARRLIEMHDDIIRFLEETREARRERKRLLEAGELSQE